MPERDTAPGGHAPAVPAAAPPQAADPALLGGAPTTLGGLLAHPTAEAEGVVTAMQRRVGNRATTAWIGRWALASQPGPAAATSAA